MFNRLWRMSLRDGYMAVALLVTVSASAEPTPATPANQRCQGCLLPFKISGSSQNRSSCTNYDTSGLAGYHWCPTDLPPSEVSEGVCRAGGPGSTPGCVYAATYVYTYEGRNIDHYLVCNDAATCPPTQAPSRLPTRSPITPSPTRLPSTSPTRSPTKSPTRLPSTSPTRAPSNAPTRAPSKSPTRAPSTAPTPSQSAACDAAEEACRADDSTCGGCLDVDLKNQPLRAALTVLSGLSGLAQSACTGTPQAHLGAVLRRCPLLTASNSTGCLDAMLNCSRQAGGPGDCRGLIVPAAGPSGGQAFAAIDYTRVLDATLNELQYACRNDFRPAGHGDGTGSFPVLPAHWSCASGVSACANDPGCWGCFTAYQQVSSMEMIGLDALTRCTSATGYLQLNRVLASCNQTVPGTGHFSEHSANSSTAAEFYYSQLPQACLKHGWACTTDSTSGCDRCMLSVGNTALRPAHGAQPTLSEWHATFTSSDCRGAMQSQGDVDDDHHPGDDDLYAGYGLAYDATDFGRAMAYCSRPGENIPGGSQRNLVCIYQSLLCDDTDSCRVCLGGPPTATSVPVKGGSRCKDPLSVITRFCPPDYVHFMKCPEKVAINNRLVMATSVFGFISTAAVVCTLAVIYGYRKDQSSLRERILTGVFAGNLLYSVVNMIPIAVEETDAAICGDPYYVESQSLVRGLWFGAKYTMVAYELFVIYASVVALKTGSINMARNHERAAHAACGATGLVAFALFYHAAQDSFAESVSATTYTQQIAARDEYDKLVQLTVQLWLILLGVMAVMWIYQRYIFRGLRKQWEDGLAEAQEDWDRDLWKRGDKHVEGERYKRRRLLDMASDGYDEIAKPLEAYVAVFILWGAPAALMATSFCVDDSEDPYKTVNCQHVCELVLAFRSLATVGVYFRDEQCRDQLANIEVLRGKVWRRMQQQCGRLCCAPRSRATSTGVWFPRPDKIDEVRFIEEFELHVEPQGDGTALTIGGCD